MITLNKNTIKRVKSELDENQYSYENCRHLSKVSTRQGKQGKSVDF